MSNLPKAIHLPLGRFSLFLIYFWFGFLKIISLSPASPLVSTLLEKTLPFLPVSGYIFGLGIFEMLIGFLFILPKMERLAICLFFVHMGMTTLPLIFLPAVVWQTTFVPTLEGQYIIKNLALVTIVFTLWAKLPQRKIRI
ncbi:MAG: hypothetical protein G01um101420_233 [Parcubacteria group bacterium Gr01-1014_20]|nr:MAG: hypothetical protein G01um101420_233 [Parcubacteria group bacterium Gr01-1014_20]